MVYAADRLRVTCCCCSGNWRGFAIDQQLKVGDAVVWEVFPCGFIFRVFVFRAGCYETCPVLKV